MIATGALEHVCYKLGRNGSATLVLFVLAGVGEERDDGCDAFGASDLASVDHNAEFHERRIDCAASSVHDVDVVLAHRF